MTKHFERGPKRLEVGDLFIREKFGLYYICRLIGIGRCDTITDMGYVSRFTAERVLEQM